MISGIMFSRPPAGMQNYQGFRTHLVGSFSSHFHIIPSLQEGGGLETGDPLGVILTKVLVVS